MELNYSLRLGLLLACTAGITFGQAPAPAATPALEFEVASVKPSAPLDRQKVLSGQAHIGVSIDSARVDIGNLSMADLVRFAYRMKPYQITGPDWMTSERFDIIAKLPEGASKDHVPEMLQALLADRFKLTAHRETKDHSAYGLMVGKNGPKLKDAAPLPAAVPDAPPAKGGLVMGSGEYQVRVEPNADRKGATISSPQFVEMKISMGENGMMRMEFARMTMHALADTLSRYTDKPVVDLTELTGTYQVTLDLSMEDLRGLAMAAGMGQAMGGGGGMMGRPRAGEGDAARGPAESASTPGGSIFTAIQALGLKMESRKVPVENLIIDHLEKEPSEN